MVHRVRSPRALRWAQFIAAASGIGLVLPWAVPHAEVAGATVRWLIDLAVHWQWLYAPAMVLAAVALAVLKKQVMWLALAPVAALPALTAAPALTEGTATPTSSVLTVAEANVEFHNTDPTPVMAWLKQTQPDVVVLLEVSEPFAAALAAWSDYPHRKVLPSGDPFGIAVLSRHPLTRLEVKPLRLGMDTITVSMDWRGQPVALTAVHTMPPLTPDYVQARDRDVADLTATLIAARQPALMVGDLNATPWSSAFGQMSGLRRTTSLAPTWHAAARGLTGIPIDHVLASTNWQVAGHARGPDIGSDHLPVVVRMTLAGGRVAQK